MANTQQLPGGQQIDVIKFSNFTKLSPNVSTDFTVGLHLNPDGSYLNILIPLNQIVSTGSSSTQNLSQVLNVGNSTGGKPIILTSGDTINFSVGSGGILNSLSTTASRTWSLPNNSGAIALLSDIHDVGISASVIAAGTGTSITNGSWQFIGDDIIPIITGSNIGSTSNRIGTVFINSVVDYGSNIYFYNGSDNTMTLTAGGNLGIGGTPLSPLHINSSMSNEGFRLTNNGGNNSRFKLFLGDGTGGFSTEDVYFSGNNANMHFVSQAGVEGLTVNVPSGGFGVFYPSVGANQFAIGKQTLINKNGGGDLLQIIATDNTQAGLGFSINDSGTMRGRIYVDNQFNIAVNNDDIVFWVGNGSGFEAARIVNDGTVKLASLSGVGNRVVEAASDGTLIIGSGSLMAKSVIVFTPGTVGTPNTISHGLPTDDIIVQLTDVTTGNIFYGTVGNATMSNVDITFSINPSGDVKAIIIG